MSRYFWPIFTPPSPLSHFVTHPGTPESTSHISDPRFLEGLVQKPDKNRTPLYKFCLNCSRVFLFGGFVRGSFVWKVLSGVVFHVLSEYICYIRKLNNTLNFMFRMYDNFFYKCDVTCSLPPPLCHKLSHLLGRPLERDVHVLYGRPLWLDTNRAIGYLKP